MKNPSIAYLGSPYSHPDSIVRKFRLDSTSKLAAQLFNQGRFVYSPLTHNIPLSQFGNVASFENWGKFDLMMLSRCDELLVYQLPGWEDSKGLTSEINFAKENHIPINYIAYEETEKPILKSNNTNSNGSKNDRILA